MSKIKQYVRHLAVVAAATLLAHCAWADKVIAINFGETNDQIGDTEEMNLLGTTIAGSHWNQFFGASGSATTLKEYDTEAGTSSEKSISLSFASKNTWRWGRNNVSANSKYLISYLDDGDANNRARIEVTGIPYTAYDVVLFMVGDTAGANQVGSPTVNGSRWAYVDGVVTKVNAATGWGEGQQTTATEGKNAIRVSKLSGDLSINGGRDGGRGTIAAIAIYESQAKVVDVNGGSAYTATEAEAVEGDIINITLNDGATLTLDKDLTRDYNLISEGSITLTGDYVTAENIAKLNVAGVVGGVVRVIDSAAIPEGLAAPTAGWIYRYVGTTALATIPFYNVAHAGIVEVACPVTDLTTAADTGLFTGNKAKVVFAEGFSLANEQDRIGIGNQGGVTQSYVQKAGDMVFTREGNADTYSGGQNETPLLMGHWSSTVSYDLIAGSITAANGVLALGWDGALTMTVGGDDAKSALLKAKGINGRQRNTVSSLTINKNGTVEVLSDFGVKLNTNKKIVLNGGVLKFDETCKVENGGTIDLTANSTVNVAEGKTVTIDVVLTGTGDLVKTGAGTLVISKVPNGYTGAIRITEGTLDVQGNRDLQNVVFTEGTTLVARETTADDGTMTITGVSGTPTIKLYNALGEEIPAGSISVEGTTITATFTPTVAGKGCWMDYEFKGSLTNIGTDTTGLTRDGSDFGQDASSDFKTNDEGEAYALYTGTHPWRNVTYPTEWSCAIYCSVPDYAKAALITFGTQGGGLIGLIAGTEKDQVLLVRTTGNSAYEVLATMAVPNAATAQHLYTFSKTAREIKVYLDGKLWTTYTSASDISFGGGMQIASVHGGVGSTGIVRFDKALFNNNIENETLRKSLIGMMRLYNSVLGPNAAKVLSDEFPYVSPSGLFTREISESGTWSQEDAWTKVLESGNVPATIPEEGAVVKVATADAETVANLTMNLEADMTTESLDITGGGIISFSKGETSGKLSNSGATSIDAAVTIKYGTLDISGGPLTLGTNGSISFDLSDYSIESIYAPETIFLTGMTEQDDDKITATVAQPQVGRKMTFGYDSATQRYIAKVSATREAAGDLNVGEGDVEISDATVYTDSEGNETIRFFADDWIVVSHEQTLTITEDLTYPAKIKVVEGGVLKLNFGSDVTISDFKYNATVRVEKGGVYDIANANGHKDYSHPIVLAGGTLTNTGIATTVDARQYWQNTVVADSTIDVSGNEFGAVNGGHAAHDYNLGGNVLTKTGAGQFTFKTANFVGGGTLAVEEGTFILDNCTVPEGATLDFVVASGATIIVKGNQLAKTGTVTGSGTVIYENGVNTDAIYQDEGWTGTLWIKGMNWNDWDLGREGTAGSSLVKLTGFTGYAPNNTSAGCNATVELADSGTTKAVSVNNGYSTGAFFFKKIIGSGTFTATSANTSKHIYKFHDVSEFTGKLEAKNIRIVVGNGNVGDDHGTMAFTDGVVINGGLNWSAAKVTFGETLKVKGSVGDAIVTVTTLPETMPTVTLLDADGQPVEGEYTLEADGTTLKVVAVQVGPEPIDPSEGETTVEVKADSADAACAMVTIVAPDGVGADAYAALFKKTATQAGMGIYEVEVALDEEKVDAEETTAEIISVLETAEGNALTLTNAKPGLYYQLIEGATLEAMKGTKAGVQADSSGVTLEKTVTGASAFFRVKVSAAPLSAETAE